MGAVLLALCTLLLVGSTHGGAAQTASAPAVGTPAAGAPRTVGELADRVNAAWAGVRTYRAVQTFGAADPITASPPAAAAGVVTAEARGAVSGTTEEGIVPDRRHHVTRVDDVVVSEAIAVAGRVWVRGTLARFVRPDVDDQTWVVVDPAALDRSTQPSAAFVALAAPVGSPYAALAPDLRAQALRPLGPVVVGGTTCQRYGATSTTQTGERVDVVVALGPDDLVCSVETRAGGTINVLTYVAYNEPVVIEPPADAVPAGTPTAGLGARG